MDKVYLVCGSTGEFSDRTQWNIAAYPEEAMACLHVEKANAWLKDHGVRDYADSDDFPEGCNPYDPSMQMLGEVRYGYEAVPLCLHLDQFQERFPPAKKETP